MPFDRRNRLARRRLERLRRRNRVVRLEQLETRYLLAAELVLSEFMADNISNLADGNGAFSDWIEIHNKGDAVADLSGWHLTDDETDLPKWTFDSGSLGIDERLVVFASGTGNSTSVGSVDSEGNLHANFQLNVSGEYLALVHPDLTVVTEFSPTFPRQFADISYGTDPQMAVVYFDQPTPGTANGSGLVGFLDDTRFSVDRGVFQSAADAFDVAITTTDPAATIVFTLDGSAPEFDTQVVNGSVYTEPININTTTTLRAAAFRDGYLATNVDTQTYVFLDEVLTQTNQAPGGAHWDTGMDPNVVNDVNQTHSVADALVALPVVSIAMDNEDLFGANGIYPNATSRGDAWERAGSVEFFYPNEYGGYRSESGFSINAGIQMAGGASRFNHNPKHSFRMVFKREYDDPTLNFPLYENSSVDVFNTLQLRTGHNQGWFTGQPSSQYIRDRYARELQLDLGQASSHGQFVHLYLNGLYWGMYDLAERPDEAFSAENFGGAKEEYDVVKGSISAGENQARLVNGTRDAWDEMMAIAAQDLSDPDNYLAIQDYLDVDNLIDYVISNQITGEQDAPTCICNGNNPRNFWATRRRDSGEGFRFFRWDSEFTLQDINIDVSEKSGPDNPATLHVSLRANPEYRLRFADRVQQHMFNDGALTVAANVERYERLAELIDVAVVAESARWGDFKREPPFTRDVEWLNEQNRILNQYLPQRNQVALNQFIADGLYPSLNSASLTVNGQPQHGGEVTTTDSIGLQANTGTIYYTTDGTDPRINPFEVTTLIDEGASATALVPSDDTVHAQWTQTQFDDSSWLQGTTGVGFDRNGILDSHINLDLLSSQLNPSDRIDTDGDGVNENDSVYVRVPFSVDDPNDIDELNLRLRYDDGFVAYLNGQEVARDNAPDPVLWDSAALTDTEADGIVMMAIAYDENNQITIYRNGEVYATAANTSKGTLNNFSAGMSQALFGRRHTGANGFLEGFVEEAQIWDDALTADQVADLFTQGVTSEPNDPPPDPEPETGIDAFLAHKWTFNVDASDLVGSAHGTLHNGAEVVNGHLVVDGVNDYLRTATIDSEIIEKTLVTWVQLDNLDQSGAGLLSLEMPAGTDVYDNISFADQIVGQWTNGSDNDSRTTVGDNGGAFESLTSPDEVMIAVSYLANGDVHLYRDGTLYASNTTGGPVTFGAGTADVVLGLPSEDGSGTAGTIDGDDGFFAGQINEARIYDAALDGTQIASLFLEGPDLTSDVLMAHQWTFNIDATDSRGSADGALIGGAQVANGKLSLDGINDYMRTSTIDSSIAERTLISWVSLDNLQQRAGSALTIENPNGGDVFDGIIYGERVANQWMNGSNGFTRSVGNNGGASETLQSPETVMMAIVYGTDNSISLYRDGQFYASANQGSLQTYAGGVADVLIGLRHLDLNGSTGSATGADGYLAGEIDEARIYSAALTLDQIAEIFAHGPVSSEPAPPYPLHQWTFSGDATDSIGNADGTLHGNAQIIGGRLELDGVDDYVGTAPIEQDISSKTLVAWVSIADLGQQRGGGLLTLEDPTGGDTFDGLIFGEQVAQQWTNTSDGWLRNMVGDNGGELESSTETVMLAAVYDSSGQVNIYRDGELYASHSTTPPVNFASGVADVLIGLRNADLAGTVGVPAGTDPYLAGSVDEARLYGTALTPSQISTLFRAGPVDDAPPPPPQLIHHWTFEGDTQDIVGHANGTLVGGAEVSDGRLIMDGVNDEMLSSPIGNSVGAKTLVSWVGLSTLSQGGGSALTLQSVGGSIFDAIVFGERTPQQWMAGSNGFTRSVVNNGGAPEQNAGNISSQQRTFDLTAHIDKLVPDVNVLAIQGLDVEGEDSDLLVSPVLTSTSISESLISSSAIEFTSAFTIDESTEINARVLNGTTWSALTQATFSVNHAQPNELVVSEFSYNPASPSAAELAVDSTLTDDDFEFVELLNISPQSLALTDVEFVDGSPVTFSFADSSIQQLEPNERVLVVGNRQAFELRYGVGLPIAGEFESGGLANGGEGITVVGTGNTILQDFTYDDRLPWPITADGYGFSLVLIDPTTNPDHNNPFNWRASGDVHGSPGVADIATQPPIAIVEALTHTDAPSVDAIELFNPTDGNVDIGGWFLSDDDSNLTKFVIPGGTVISAGQQVFIEEDDDANPLTVPPSAYFGSAFSLSSLGDEVVLSSGDGVNLTGYTHGFSFSAAENGRSFIRHIDSTGYQHFTAQTGTPGTTIGQPNDSFLVGDVVITEAHYNPDDGNVNETFVDEFIELQNTTDSLVSLFDVANPTNTWRIDGAGFSFPMNSTLAAGQLALVVGIDPALYRTRYSIDPEVAIFGPYAGALSNGGERLSVQRPDTPELNSVPFIDVDVVDYRDRSPWPNESDGANGDGSSLTRLANTDFGSDPASWRAAEPTPGQLGNLQVVSIEINAGMTDPADLAKGQQPTDWATQRSLISNLTVQFNKSISAVTANDVELINLGINADVDQDVPIVLLDVQLNVVDRQLTISFDHDDLSDGVYSLTIKSSVTDLSGNRLDNDGDFVADDYVFAATRDNQFYRLTSEFSGDEGVSVFDFSTFSYWFGVEVPDAPAYADMNDDGGVSVFDFTLFSNNFGVGVVYPVAFAAVQTSLREDSLVSELVDDPQAIEETARRDLPSFVEQIGRAEDLQLERFDNWPNDDNRVDEDDWRDDDDWLAVLTEELALVWRS